MTILVFDISHFRQAGEAFFGQTHQISRRNFMADKLVQEFGQIPATLRVGVEDFSFFFVTKGMAGFVTRHFGNVPALTYFFKMIVLLFEVSDADVFVALDAFVDSLAACQSTFQVTMGLVKSHHCQAHV